jgi:osmoprotectant transport system permease protein
MTAGIPGSSGDTGAVATRVCHRQRPIASDTAPGTTTRLVLAFAFWLLGANAAVAQDAPVTVASKSFTEGVILGEIAATLLREAGIDAVHRRQLGGTRLVFNALVSGDVDVGIDYTGTLSQEILGLEGPVSETALAAALAARGIAIGGRLGFQNNFAFGMRREDAGARGIRTISDLAQHPALRIRVSSEFMQRADGWPGVQRHYALPHEDVRGVDHDLAYRAIESGSADVIDLYTTDAEIAYYDLQTLDDDRGFFPRYDAVLIYRQDLARRVPGALDALQRMVGLLDERTMISLNGAVKLTGRGESEVAAELVRDRLSLDVIATTEGRAARLLRHTLEHTGLVLTSLAAAILLAVPLGILSAHRPGLGQIVLAAVEVAQTIPALALLVFMIPLFGIGAGPALAALFLYSLLPIVRNTHAGVLGISPELHESALALGLPFRARLWRIELPLALPTIIAGIKTAAVINVGAATLGALVGAGGYGQPILTGIRLDDVGLILEGAVPAAVFALAIKAGFELLERRVLSPGLR